MYYVAVMDCNDELHLLLGNERVGRVSVWVWLTGGDSELPFEMHGMMQVDIVLIVFFIAIASYNFYSWSVFAGRYELSHTPHTMCMVAMIL